MIIVCKYHDGQSIIDISETSFSSWIILNCNLLRTFAAYLLFNDCSK